MGRRLHAWCWSLLMVMVGVAKSQFFSIMNGSTVLVLHWQHWHGFSSWGRISTWKNRVQNFTCMIKQYWISTHFPNINVNFLLSSIVITSIGLPHLQVWQPWWKATLQMVHLTITPASFLSHEGQCPLVGGLPQGHPSWASHRAWTWSWHAPQILIGSVSTFSQRVQMAKSIFFSSDIEDKWGDLVTFSLV